MGVLDNGYCYKIGSMETIIYDETINSLTNDYGNVINKEQIEYAVEQLRKYGNMYWATIDEFCLLLHFMEKENVTVVTSHKE